MVVTLVFAMVFSHFLTCVTEQTTISTTSSCVLYSILALKVYFLYEYRAYKALLNRRIFIYILLALIFGINLIPIFTDNNLGYGTHLGNDFVLL